MLSTVIPKLSLNQTYMTELLPLKIKKKTVFALKPNFKKIVNNNKNKLNSNGHLPNA